MAAAELDRLGLHSYLGNLDETLHKYGDKMNAQLLHELRIKLEHQEITVACIGYISSGKSRLLNALIDKDNLLPVSPLATSANSVYIRPGKSPNIRLWPKNKPSTDIPLPEREEIHQLCQDANLDRLELFGAAPEGLSYIDTSGIDSIESGKKQAENPALFLADLVIYVTDYHRVESEVNFSFLKALESRQIPYYLVINQIDKHVSLELSFDDFQARLIRTLKQWGLNPSKIYFTSLLKDRPLECQLDQLKKQVFEVAARGAQQVEATVIRSVKQVIDRHSQFFLEQQDPLRAPHLWVKEQSSSEQEMMAAVQKLEKQIKTLTSLADTLDFEMSSEINKLLDNAPLFTFETRELAKHFLESRQPGFKTGFLGRSFKTKAEQDRRLQTFYKALATRAEANLTWHLRTILAEIPARYTLSLENFGEQVSQLKVELEPELLLETIRPGAIVSGEYIINYSRDLNEAIKSVYRQSSRIWIERAQEGANLKIQQELASLKEQLEDQRRALKSVSELKKLDVLHEKHIAELFKAWDQVRAQFPATHLWDDTGWLDSDRNLRLEKDRVIRKKENIPQRKFPKAMVNSSSTTLRRGHPKLWKTAQDLKNCADLIASLPGFELRVQAIQQRATRLEDNLFTVALFGAFSAGKSSLANALLGASVLPVSPNPTTATINKILPPTEQYPHGTAKVKLKSLSDLTTDVLSSLAVLGLSAEDLNQALLAIPDLDTQEVALEAKPHLSFLRAVARGQKFLLEHLGEELTVGFTDFCDFVVQEDKACFVEGIELYFSCPLTELGVVLVDTPGSNSTNARHTNVAFDYIKNADAVLFVTYYNNPFSKADAQFLSQLGKVKDTFEMDKLFFLVNASDLAETPEELDLVLKHVELNLRSCDIIKPRLFPVSSQLALLAKLASLGELQPQTEQLYRQRLKIGESESLPEPEKVLMDSGLKAFEASFNAFIEEDLIHLAVESAKREIQRTFHYVVSLLEAAKSDDSIRLEKLQQFRTLEQEIPIGLGQISLLAEESSIGQELDELFFYVNQRLNHRSSETFDRNFFSVMAPKLEHPRKVIQQCMEDFIQEIEVELKQELRATFLRAERFVQKSVSLVSSKYETLINQYDSECRVQNGYKIHAQEEPTMIDLSWDKIALSKVPDLYKNPKDWVEGRGKEKMRDMLLKILQPQVQNWLNACCASTKEYWAKRFKLEIKELKEQMCSDITGYYAGLSTALGDGYDLNVLEDVQAELKKMS